MAGAFSSAFSSAFDVGAGVAFDAASNSGYQAAASSYSWSHACTGSNRFLAVDVALLSAGQTVSGITYNGVALSLIGARSTVTSFGRVESWGLVNPASGSNTIAVTLSGTIASSAQAVSYAGVHQTTPTESFNSGQATNVGAADATVSITPIADNDWVHAAVATDDTSITAGQTTRNNVSGVGGSGANEDFGPQTPASAKSMTYTGVGALATWAIGGYAIRPVSAPSGALAGTCDLSFGAGSSTVSGAGALLGVAAASLTPLAALGGTGALAGIAASAFGSGSSTLAGAGAMSGSCSAGFTGSALVNGNAPVAGQSTLNTAASAVINGKANVSGTAASSFGEGSSTLSGTANFAGAASVAFAASAAAVGDGSLSGLSTTTIVASGVIQGGGLLAGAGLLALNATGGMLQGGVLAGTVQMTFYPSLYNATGHWDLQGAEWQLWRYLWRHYDSRLYDNKRNRL